MLKQDNKGFTLVELTIVLVILALLAGGIMLSSEAMLGRSNVSALISKINDLSAASRTFKSRFGYFPGDLPNAQSVVSPAISPGCNYAVAGTVGNGLVDSATESACALEHLVQAQLLSKVEFNSATNSYFIAAGGQGGQVSLWFNSATNQNAVRVGNLPCDIALEIDRKLDNGAAASPLSQGVVLGFDSAGTALATCANGTNIGSLLIGY